MQHVSDLYPKFALRPHHVWQYGRHPISDGWDYHNRFTALFRDHPDKPLPEENWTLWCKGRLF